jgi:hypothetical protein
MSYWLPVGLSLAATLFRRGERRNDMNKALSTLTVAGGAGLGLALASTSAKAFVPLVLGAIIGGSVLGGAVLGSAASNANNYPTVVTPVAPTVASEPAVTVNSKTCHFAHRWINGVRHRVRVCTVAAAPAPAVVPEAAVPEYGYGYGAVPAYGYGYYAMAPGHCDVISGNHVCLPN